MNEKISIRAPIGLNHWALRVGMLAAILAASCRSGVETTETRDEQTLDQLTSERSRAVPPPPDDLVKTIGAAEVLTVAGTVADLYRPAAATHHNADIAILPRWDNPS